MLYVILFYTEYFEEIREIIAYRDKRQGLIFIYSRLESGESGGE